MMGVIIPLVVGSVLLVVSGFVWVARREALEQAARIGALRIAPLESVEEPITDPVTGEPAVRVEAMIARVDGPEKVLWRLERGARFTLRDDSGEATVELSGAEIAIDPKELELTDAEPSPKMRAILAEAGNDSPEPDRNARYALVHRALRQGATLTVVGVAKRSSDGAEPTDASDGAFTFTSAAGPLFVSPDPLPVLQSREAEDVRAMSAMLRMAVVLGVALVLIGGFFMIRG
jgi:hypothetical protein